MEINQMGIAGTMESSDIMITIEPIREDRLVINLISSVEKQFGKQIRTTIEQTLLDLNISGANISANDKGALDCVIKARVKAAASRAVGNNNVSWKGEGDETA